MRSRFLAPLALSVATLLGYWCPNAGAVPVPVNPSPDGPGTSVYSVLEHYYGQNDAYWLAHQISSTQLWTALSGSVGFTAEARYAADNHQFGVITDPTSSPVFNPLFTDVGQSGYISGISGSALVSGTFAFGIYDESGNNLWSSYTPANSDGYDHMVAYALPTPGEYVLAFEDLPNGGDKDFNDLVVEVSMVSPAPAPAGLLLALTGCSSLLAGWRYRRKLAIA